MFAVIEFLKKQCYVVPLSWLFDDQKKCHWPKVYKEEELQQCVISSTPPKSNWKKHAVVKILYMSSSYEEADEYLRKAIEESCSSTENGEATIALSLKNIDADDLTLEPPKKKFKDSKDTSLNTVNYEISSDEFSSDSDTTSKNKDKHRPAGSPEEFTDSELEEPSCSKEVSKPKDRSAPTFAQSTPVYHTTTPIQSASINQMLLKRLEQVIATQDQHSLMLQNILRSQQTQHAIQSRPEGYPNLPVTNKKDLQLMEDFLREEQNFSYMKKRLACIGGTNVRNCVMNMLKYILTNKVAMKYNWAGRDKRPFKSTNMMKVIFEAVRLAFDSREPSDLSDKTIKEAVQDWLKLAKSRYVCQSKNQSKHETSARTSAN